MNDLGETQDDQNDQDGIVGKAEKAVRADEGPQPDLSWRYPHLALPTCPLR